MAGQLQRPISPPSSQSKQQSPPTCGLTVHGIVVKCRRRVVVGLVEPVHRVALASFMAVARRVAARRGRRRITTHGRRGAGTGSERGIAGESVVTQGHRIGCGGSARERVTGRRERRRLRAVRSDLWRRHRGVTNVAFLHRASGFDLVVPGMVLTLWIKHSPCCAAGRPLRCTRP